MELQRNERTGVYNFSDILEEYDDAKGLARNGPYAPQHFFRGCIVGPSGCGKTSLLLSLILAADEDTIVRYDKIYIYAKNIHEDAYRFIKDVLTKLAERMKEDGVDPIEFVLSDSLKEVPQTADLDKKKVNLMIFDDWANDAEKDQNIITQHYKMGRKEHCSYFYLSQSYFKIPKFIRGQSTHLYIFKLASRRDIDAILREHNPMEISEEGLRAAYHAATAEKYSFLQINTKDLENPIKLGLYNNATFK